MNVDVDEAGKKSGVAEVDDLRGLGMLNGFANGANAFAFDKDFAGLEDSAGVNLKQARRVENDGRR
jgi:hypothetical protein